MVQAPPAVELGPFNMTPWNLTAFQDTTAKWIWSRPGANTLAPTHLYAVCWKTLVVSVDTTATLHAFVDDMALVLVNGKQVATITRYMLLS